MKIKDIKYEPLRELAYKRAVEANEYEPDEISELTIDVAFTWSSTPEGSSFWGEICNLLNSPTGRAIIKYFTGNKSKKESNSLSKVEEMKEFALFLGMNENNFPNSYNEFINDKESKKETAKDIPF